MSEINRVSGAKDCLHWVRSYTSTNPSFGSLKVTKHGFDYKNNYLTKPCHLSLPVFYWIFYEMWTGNKTKEIRVFKNNFRDKQLINFAKACNDNNGKFIPNKGILSIQAGYKGKGFLRFSVKDCYYSTCIIDTQPNGNIVKSSKELIVFEFGDCLEVIMTDEELQCIKNKHKIEKKTIYNLDLEP